MIVEKRVLHVNSVHTRALITCARHAKGAISEALESVGYATLYGVDPLRYLPPSVMWKEEERAQSAAVVLCKVIQAGLDARNAVGGIHVQGPVRAESVLRNTEVLLDSLIVPGLDDGEPAKKWTPEQLKCWRQITLMLQESSRYLGQTIKRVGVAA